jgi:hypothetical protein
MLLIVMLLGAALLGTSCQQAPIFLIISREVAPKKPLIDGSPSKIVETGYNHAGAPAPEKILYVANGELWKFEGGGWGKDSAPPTDGVVADVAAAENGGLYAITADRKNDDTEIWERPASENWKRLLTRGGYGIQSIYCANNELFYAGRSGAPAQDGLDYAIYKSDNTLIKSGTGLLRGVVYVNNLYFLATAGDGIWVYDGTIPASSGTNPNPYQLDDTGGMRFTGIIKTDETNNIIIAVTHSGYVYQIDGRVSPPTVMTGYPITIGVLNCTGALAIWNNNSAADSLLLVSVKRSASYYGYRDMPIDKAAGVLTKSYYEPGNGSPSSMKDHNAYIATIEEHTVNSLIQAPGLFDHELPVVFASTQQNGVWSLRYDSSEGKHVWNAQD